MSIRAFELGPSGFPIGLQWNPSSQLLGEIPGGCACTSAWAYVGDVMFGGDVVLATQCCILLFGSGISCH